MGNLAKDAFPLPFLMNGKSGSEMENYSSASPIWSLSARKQAVNLVYLFAFRMLCITGKRDWYNDWACVECCTGDLCNYYVTVRNQSRDQRRAANHRAVRFGAKLERSIKP